MQPEPRTREQQDQFIPGSILSIKVFGIPVRLHFTFVLLFVFLISVGFAGQSMWADVVYIGAIFGSVILHELGHALVARRYGVRTVEIVMFPIGGVARLDRNPGPREEFWIASAGPAVNIVLAALLFGYLAATGAAGLPLQALAIASDHTLPHRIAAGNLILALFNLLPAFPMDGGRILRSLLARRRPQEQATRIAARAGQALAILMGLYGLLIMNFFLVFIAFFVYLGAAQEAAMAQGRILTQGMPVRAAMVTDFRTLAHGETIRDAAALLLATTQQDFPVMHGESVIGLLGRTALVRGIAHAGPDAFVAGIMDRDFPRVESGTDLADAMSLLSQGRSCVLVMDGDRLQGLLTAENLSEFLLLRRVGMPLSGQSEMQKVA
ncbi:MAG TPA: site-2 protease family protein [Bryobacteraceae bacterium]|nr:site-2 protease family protein [Bryobacteraceae bacterium]